MPVLTLRALRREFVELVGRRDCTMSEPRTRTKYTYDSAGRSSEAQDTANNINYALGTCSNGISSTGVCYAPNGSVAQVQNGTNLVSTYIYNKRFQPCWMYGTTGTALPTNTTCTAGDPGPGNILDLQYNFNLSAGDNGNVVGITNKRDSTRTQSFTYDQLNRIVQAQTSATSGSNCWGETYTIDQWGNLTVIGALSGYSGCTQENLAVSATTNNQLSSTGFSYDTSGNMLTDGANTYGYNAESEIKSAAGVNYTYDGDGNRVEKSSGKIYWYGAGTEILDESDTSGNITNEYVFFGGKRVAMRNVSSGTIYYYEDDMLGSARTMVQAGQTSLCYDGDFYPFGGERIITNTCTQNYKFEGKERDTETGNDDFGARYYTSRLGRWLSADWSAVPAPVPYANLTNPQTLNLYAMVSDNPETFADLDGHLTGTEGLCWIDVCAAKPSLDIVGDGYPPPQNNGTGTPNSATQQVLAWSSLSADQQSLVSGGEKKWNALSAEQQDNFAAITHALLVTQLMNGKSALSEIKDVRSIGTRDIAVDWGSGASKAFQDSGFAWRPGWGHSGESGMIGKPTGNGKIEGSFFQAQGIHVLFNDADKGASGNIHIDYRGILAGHYSDANDDVRQNYLTYKRWFGPIPGYEP